MSVSISADDRFLIQDLHGRYSRAIDTQDNETYASLFATDGVLHMPNKSYRGRQEISAYIKELTGGDAWPGYRHHSTQLLFEEGAGERARLSAYSTVLFRERDGTNSFRVQGIYRDVVVKVGSDWFFAERSWEPWNPDTLERYRPAPR